MVLVGRKPGEVAAVLIRHPQPLALQSSPNARADLLDRALQLGRCRGRYPPKPHAVSLGKVDAVEHERMEVQV